MHLNVHKDSTYSNIKFRQFEYKLVHSAICFIFTLTHLIKYHDFSLSNISIYIFQQLTILYCMTEQSFLSQRNFYL